MKYILSILTICVILTSCKQAEKIERDSYIVSGDAPGIYNGIRIYLKSADQRGKQVNKDTAIVMNEKFTFEGKVSHPEMWYLSGNGINGSLPFIIENSIINIDLNKDNISESKVKGTESNESFMTFQENIKKLADKQRTLNQDIRVANQSQDTDKVNLLTQELNSIKTQIDKFPFEFVEKNKSSIFSLSLLEKMVKSKNQDLTKTEIAFNSLDENLRTSVHGKQISNHLLMVKAQTERLKATQIGAIAPSFSATTPDGKTLALNDIKGKVTIIDFWASWCKPCRRENPNVVKVYEKYHDKGLEIIAVSLDKQGQKDKWIKAIQDDNLSWHHVSNLSSFNDPVAQAYNIKSIPSTFIIDEEGKIIAKNLRGAALGQKMAELLD